MDELKNILYDILDDIDDEINEFDGENLIEAGLLDSFTIVTILAMVEERLNIKINPEDVKEINFKTVDAILALINNSRK